MKVALHIAIGLILRVLYYFSPYKESICHLITYKMSPYMFSKIKENFVYSFYFGDRSFQSNQVFIVKFALFNC